MVQARAMTAAAKRSMSESSTVRAVARRIGWFSGARISAASVVASKALKAGGRRRSTPQRVMRSPYQAGSASAEARPQEIGRASCRERVLSVRVDLGGSRIIKKKNKHVTKLQ